MITTFGTSNGGSLSWNTNIAEFMSSQHSWWLEFLFCKSVRKAFYQSARWPNLWLAVVIVQSKKRKYWLRKEEYDYNSNMVISFSHRWLRIQRRWNLISFHAHYRSQGINAFYILAASSRSEDAFTNWSGGVIAVKVAAGHTCYQRWPFPRC